MKPILNYKERVIAYFEDEFSKLYIVGKIKLEKLLLSRILQFPRYHMSNIQIYLMKYVIRYMK